MKKINTDEQNVNIDLAFTDTILMLGKYRINNLLLDEIESEQSKIYKFVVIPGNNPEIIKQTLNLRSNFVEVCLPIYNYRMKVRMQKKHMMVLISFGSLFNLSIV